MQIWLDIDGAGIGYAEINRVDGEKRPSLLGANVLRLRALYMDTAWPIVRNLSAEAVTRSWRRVLAQVADHHLATQSVPIFAARTYYPTGRPM